jgi:hypothetical protein
LSTGRIRRAQLVTPFGVGAMSILVNGTSVVTAGLDHWYEADDPADLYIDEFVVDDWRLRERLKVRQLRLPPDHRPRRKGTGGRLNTGLSVPVLRFPRWSFCIYCKRLVESTLSMAEPVRCPDPKHAEATRGPAMSQVPFVTICQRGHLDDFPWREWAHRSLHPACTSPLRLLSRGGGTLAGQVVRCDCGEERPLEGVLQASADGEQTTLTTHLSREGEYACRGSKPWVADPGSGCDHPLRGALRAAGNVYFPKVESSIFLPRQQGGASAEVLDLLRRPDLQTRIQLISELAGEVSVPMLRRQTSPELLDPISDEELEAALRELAPGRPPDAAETDGEDLTSIADWRRPEYQLLRESPAHPDLTASDPGTPEDFRNAIGRVRRVDVLRETRALRGFCRVRDGVLRLSAGKAMLRRNQIPAHHDWLPAYEVRGEGIYLELDKPPSSSGKPETTSGTARAGWPATSK